MIVDFIFNALILVLIIIFSILHSMSDIIQFIDANAIEHEHSNNDIANTTLTPTPITTAGYSNASSSVSSPSSHRSSVTADSNTAHESPNTSTALVVFSYASPFTDRIKSEQRLFTFYNQNITMKQKWESGGKGGSDIGFGCSVYDGSFVLAAYLERYKEDLLLGKKVVELGSGPALISVVASLGDAGLVTCTDGDDISVALARENLMLNCAMKSNFFTKRLLWGHQPDIDGVLDISNSKYDLVVASDVAALPYEEHYGNLVETLYQLSHKDSILLLCFQRRHSSEDRFFELLKTRFNFRKVARSDLHNDFRDKPIILFSGTPIM